MSYSDKEKEIFHEWAKGKEKTYCFTQKDDLCQSYYNMCNNDSSHLRIYDFQSFMDLKMELDQMWNEDPIMLSVEKYVLGAAMKNKETVMMKDKEQSQKSESQLKPYIYNF